jgi:TFIIF-interacting CTD phosphatase-like protein
MVRTRKPINVVLDLDNTLIYSIDYNKVDKNKPQPYKCYPMDQDYLVCERPGLQRFLTWLFKNFNVMVWSAASSDYVDFIVKEIVIGKKKNRNVEHVFSSEKCDESQQKYNDDTKNLNLLWDTYDFEGYGPFNTLIVDDMKHVIKSQPNNSIRIKKFVANQSGLEDTDLVRVQNDLTEVNNRFKSTKNKNTSYKVVG